MMSWMHDVRNCPRIDHRAATFDPGPRSCGGLRFGVGFDATLMNDLPYALVVDGGGNVSEHKLANHADRHSLPADLPDTLYIQHYTIRSLRI